jgi:hypothetical protein
MRRVPVVTAVIGVGSGFQSMVWTVGALVVPVVIVVVEGPLVGALVNFCQSMVAKERDSGG